MSEVPSELKTETLADDLIDRFYDRAREWEEFFRGVSQDHWDELVAVAAPELDSMYPYDGMFVHFSGKGLFPMVDEEESVIGEGFGESQGQCGIGAGVQIAMVTKESGEKVPKVLHQILIGTGEGKPFTTVEQEQRVYALVYLESEVIPIVNIEELYGTVAEPEITEELYERVNRFSKNFRTLLRSTGFRRMSHRRQRATIDEALINSDAQSQVRELDVLVEGDYAYVPNFKEDQITFDPIGIRNVLIGGVCLAVDTIEKEGLRQKPIRRDLDLLDRNAGLCLVVDPIPETREELSLDEDKVIFVPIDGNRELEIVFSGQSWLMEQVEDAESI